MRRQPLTNDVVRQLTQRINRTLREIGRPDSDEMKEAAKLVKGSFRTVLNVRGGGRPAMSLASKRLRAVGGTPSSPGQPPRRQTGQLARSIRDRIAGDVRRVAVVHFTAPLLEGGVDTSLPRRSTTPRRGAKGTLRIAPRPFAQRALDAVKDKLAGVIATLGGKRLQDLER